MRELGFQGVIKLFSILHAELLQACLDLLLLRAVQALVVEHRALRAAALLNHLYGVKRTGAALKAADHIHYAPVLSRIYEKADRGYYDPYNIGRNLVKLFSGVMWGIDKAIDWLYNGLAPKLAFIITDRIRRLHNGSYKTYMIWSLAGAGIILIFFIRCHHYSF